MKMLLQLMSAVAILVFALVFDGTAQSTQAEAGVIPFSDGMGIIKIKPDEPIHIAAWLAVKGENKAFGVDAQRGIEIAMNDKEGKLLGHSIKLTVVNSGCNAADGRKAAAKIAADSTIVAAVGSSCSAEAQIGAPILWKAGISTVSSSNTAPYLTDPQRESTYAGYLRTSYNDKIQGIIAAQFVYSQLNLRKAAMISDGSDYSESLRINFMETFKQLGGMITSQDVVSPDERNLKSLLIRIAVHKPEAIYFPVFKNSAGYIVNQSRSVVGLENATFIGADGSFNREFYKLSGNNAIGVYQTSPAFAAFTIPEYLGFIEKYEKKYREKPITVFHAHAYDAAMMIFAAIENTAKREPDGTLYIGRKALRDALYATKAFSGAAGTHSCDEWGDCGNSGIAVFLTTQENITNLKLPEKPFWKPY